MRKIGIGVTTYKRPEIFTLFIMQLSKYIPENAKVYIAKDIPNVSQAKNECLKALEDCDHIFLFDDDCFPIAENWTDPFIMSKKNHFLYMNDYYGKYHETDNYAAYNNCSGVFMYLTKEVVSKVGYFGEYGRYGFEHAGYSHRIHKAGLSEHLYMTLKETNKLIHSLDLDGEFEGIKAKPTLTPQEAIESININRNIFLNETAN